MSVMFMMCSAALSSVLGSFKQRRSHFWMRVSLFQFVPALLPGMLALSAKIGIVGEGTLRTTGPRLAVACALSLVVGPALLFRSSSSRPEDGGGGGGPGPDPSPDPIGPSDGGIALPDADQSAARLRDHSGGGRRERKPRRAAREPDRVPTRARCATTGKRSAAFGLGEEDLAARGDFRRVADPSGRPIGASAFERHVRLLAQRGVHGVGSRRHCGALQGPRR
jgi:hypothetical protein